MNWVEWIIMAAAAAAAIIYLWRTVVRPLIRIVTIMETSVPILLEIAEEFRPNTGTSLKDKFDTVELELQGTKTRFDEFEAYVHERFHELINRLIRMETMLQKEK